MDERFFRYKRYNKLYLDFWIPDNESTSDSNTNTNVKPSPYIVDIIKVEEINKVAIMDIYNKRYEELKIKYPGIKKKGVRIIPSVEIKYILPMQFSLLSVPEQAKWKNYSPMFHIDLGSDVLISDLNELERFYTAYENERLANNYHTRKYRENYNIESYDIYNILSSEYDKLKEKQQHLINDYNDIIKSYNSLVNSYDEALMECDDLENRYHQYCY